jgi:hypothetical protein
MIDQALIDSFIDQICAKKEGCILEAMAAGIDLHEMKLREWMEISGGEIIYHCEIKRIQNNEEKG